MPDQVRHDDQKIGDFLYVDTVSQEGGDIASFPRRAGKPHSLFQKIILALLPPLRKGLLVLSDHTWMASHEKLTFIVEKFKKMHIVDIFNKAVSKLYFTQPPEAGNHRLRCFLV